MRIELIGKNWVDENNNSWNAEYNDKEKALGQSNSLVNCFNNYNCCDMRDCRDSRYSSNCTNCEGLDSCNSCYNCNNCSNSSNLYHCYNCKECRCCTYCNDCTKCQYITSCIDYKNNPQSYTHKRIGSRGENPIIYWLDGNIQCIVGCFKGTLNELEIRAKVIYPDGQYREEYNEFIKIARELVKVDMEVRIDEYERDLIQHAEAKGNK